MALKILAGPIVEAGLVQMPDRSDCRLQGASARFSSFEAQGPAHAGDGAMDARNRATQDTRGRQPILRVRARSLSASACRNLPEITVVARRSGSSIRNH